MHEHHRPDLAKLCDDILIESLPASLKEAIDAALAAGGTSEEIVALTEKNAMPTSSVRIAVEAYLERKLHPSD